MTISLFVMGLDNMREIKFRGMNFCGKWVYGDLRHDRMCMPDGKLKEYISVCGEPIHYKSVGQYTELKDCKGQEIYEGDVVEFNDSYHDINGNYCEKMQRGYIKYDYGEFAIVTLRGEAFLRLLSTCVQSDTLMVIGNVHDTPELLEVEA